MPSSPPSAAGGGPWPPPLPSLSDGAAPAGAAPEASGAAAAAPDDVAVAVEAAEPSTRRRLSPPGGALELLEKLRAGRREPAELARMPREVREFYERQNSFIDWCDKTDGGRAALEEKKRRDLSRRQDRASSVGGASDGAASAAPLAPRSSSAAQPAAAAAASAAPPQAHPRLSPEELANERVVALALNLSMAANVLLLVVKVVASAYSGSLAVVASTVDSVMDLISGFIVFVSAMMAARRDIHSFPIGKSRYEPLGIIVFAALMAAASLQLISQGAMQLSKGLGGGSAGSEAATAAAEELRGERGNVTFAVLACVILVKGLLFAWCRSLRFLSSSVGALALDHYNDVITNLLPLFAVLITSNFPLYWWVDPAIAVLMSIYMVNIWSEAAREQISLIAGRAATPREIGEVTFLALTHSPSVLAVDTILAYQLGNKLQAEVDIVLPEDMPLRESHDVGELLQFRVEALPNIERCFVHLDYEWQHSKDDEHYNPYLQPSYAPGED